MALPLPKSTLSQEARVLTLTQILSHFNPNSFEAAQTTYRMPSYQRELNKPAKWNKKLVESVVSGLAIGGLVMSKHIEHKNEDGEQYYDEFYNIEDGGTRLRALFKFFNGKFATKYGRIYNDDIKHKFTEYQVTVTLITKADSRISNREYFRALCKNFQLLQESTKLTASERYGALVANDRYSFTGSPIVNFTIEVANKNEIFKNFFGLSNIGPKDKHRTKLASGVALVYGIILGPNFANESFYNHVPTIFDNISAQSNTRFNLTLELFVSTITTVCASVPKWSNERFTGYFSKTKLFTGLMIADVHEAFPLTEAIVINNEWRSFSVEFTTRWTKVINEYRGRVKLNDKMCADGWLNGTVYDGLGEGHKRNNGTQDLICRMKAVRTWASQ